MRSVTRSTIAAILLAVPSTADAAEETRGLDRRSGASALSVFDPTPTVDGLRISLVEDAVERIDVVPWDGVARLESPPGGALERRIADGIEIGTLVWRGRERLRRGDALLAADGNWFVEETRHLVRRTLKRVDNSAKSFYAVADQGTSFTGTFLELALACDRIYLLNDPDFPVEVGVTTANGGIFPMANGISRLETRFLGTPEAVTAVLEKCGETLDADTADELGLATYAPDDLDWEDELRSFVQPDRISMCVPSYAPCPHVPFPLHTHVLPASRSTTSPMGASCALPVTLAGSRCLIGQVPIRQVQLHRLCHLPPAARGDEIGRAHV